MPYTVYKVPLSKDVWNDKKFSAANKDAKTTDAAYIGTTGKSIEERFNNHKTGVKHNKYVQLYGTGIQTLSTHKTWEEAHAKEIAVALEMKRNGVGIFQR